MLPITRYTGEKLTRSDGHGCPHRFVEQMSQGATYRPSGGGYQSWTIDTSWLPVGTQCRSRLRLLG
jgi:hypothetical protein